MRVADVMTTGVIAVAPETRVVDAARLLIEKRISGVAVVGADGRLVGVFTEGDLLRRAEFGTDKRKSSWSEILFGTGRRAVDYAHSHGVLVEEVMTPTPVTCGAGDDLGSVIETMIQRSVKRVVVVDGERPIGVVSRADIVRAFLTIADRNLHAEMPSSDVRAALRIASAIDAETWVPRKTVSIDVNDGRVHLSGTINDPRQRDALRVLIEREAPGLPIVDRLVWIEPFTGAVMSLPEE